MLGNTRPILLALGGTGAIVLAIACANIVGLLLVRAVARRRESAVRSRSAHRAGGSSGCGWPRARCWRARGSSAGLPGVVGHARARRAGAGEHPAARSDHVDVAGSALRDQRLSRLGDRLRTRARLAGVARELCASLQDGARDSESRSRRRARHALVVAQLALAMVLLVGAGLMIRSVLGLRELDLGFSPSRVLTIDVAAYAEAEARAAKGRHHRRRRQPRSPAARLRGAGPAREVLMKPYRLAFDRILARCARCRRCGRLAAPINSR